MAGLLALAVLSYYLANYDVVKVNNQSVHNNRTNTASIVQHHSAEKIPPKAFQSMNKDAWFIDPDDREPIVVDHATDHAPVSSTGVYLDPDADPAMFVSAQLSHQQNVGMSLDAEDERDDQIIFVASPQRDIGMALDVDGEPSDLFLSETLHPQNVGVFLDADGNGVVSHFDVGNESSEVNVGEFIDPDTSDSLL